MGTFSKYHRYRDSGEEVNVNNTERFGKPARSLFTSTKILSLRHKIDITDESENVVYRAESKIISIHDKTDIYSAKNNLLIAHIERKFFTLHERHYVTMQNGLNFQLSNEILHIYKDITNIEGLGWQLRGNIFGLNFELYDASENIIAVISQKMLSIHDKYCIDIYQPEHEETVIAILITLQHMIRDRENSSSGSISFGGNSN